MACSPDRKPRLMVSTPTRPKYIYNIIKYWAGTLRLPVVPAVRPTVAKAETASNNALTKLTGDVAQMKTAPKNASSTIAVAMVMASRTCLSGMVRQKAQTVLFPRSLAHRNSSSTTKVTVFRPPAVEPEDKKEF